MLTRRVFFNFTSAAILFASPALAGGSAPFTRS
jgi:hypothetical protein